MEHSACLLGFDVLYPYLITSALILMPMYVEHTVA